MPERQLKHIRISEAVKSSILSGELSSPLPEMGVLGQRFGASRLTMRNALLLLQEQGVVRIEHGAGTYINVAQEHTTPDLQPEDLQAAAKRYRDFLMNPGLSNAIKLRMMQIVDSQINLINDLNPSEL